MIMDKKLKVKKTKQYIGFLLLGAAVLVGFTFIVSKVKTRQDKILVNEQTQSIDPELLKGIVEVEKGKFEITRSTYDALLKDPNFLTEFQVIPAIEDKELKGFKLVNMRPGGLGEKLGLKLNDIFRKFNEKEIFSLADTQEIYMTLQTSEESLFNLIVERNGQQFALEYKVK